MKGHPPLLAIVGPTIIDGNGGTPIKDGVILIDGDRLVSVGDGSTPIPLEARLISATGQYAIPGLMDANVHLFQDLFNGPHSLIRYAGRYEHLAIEAAQVCLRGGVTTVFDTWGPRNSLVQARDAVNSGNAVGSRIYLAGNLVGLGGPFSDDFFAKGREVLPEDLTTSIDAVWQENVGPELLWMSPEQVRKEIREYAQRNIDFVKFALTTHRDKQQHIMFSPRVTQVIVEEAHRAGLTAQTHTTTNEGLHLAIQAGVELMQHVDLTFGTEPIPPETISLMAEVGIPGALLPQTAKALEWFRENTWRTPWLKRYETMDRNDRALVNAGVALLLSTDAGLFSVETLNSSTWKSCQPPEENLLMLGEGHFHWLLAVEQKGMKPMDALMAATRNIARAYKVDQQLGTLEKGKLADLLLLDRNPLEAAANYRSISLVVKDGSVIDREALPTQRFLTTQTAPQAWES